MIARPLSLRTRLTLWYVAVLAVLLLLYAALVFGFQYAVLTRQMFHDEVQDVVTAEGLLYFDSQGVLHLHQNYYSRPTSHLLVDRLMEALDLSGHILYQSPTLHGMMLGGRLQHGEGDTGFNERIVRLRDGTYVLIVSHIHALDGVTMVIRLGYSLGPLRDRMLQFLVLLLVTVPAALLVAGIAGQLIARRGLRPLEKMASRAEGITASNLHDRLQIDNPNDELGQMARVFNHLLERLDQAFRQMKRFTADAAHELRAPLASIRTTSEVALGKSGSENQYKEALANILEETGRLNETIDGLLLLARAEASQPGQDQSVFLATELVNEVLSVLSVLIEEKQISVLQDGDMTGEPTTIRADRPLLRIAFMNVLHNAVKFSPRCSTLRIIWACGKEEVRITVRDEGPGIPSREEEKVFDRFFTSSSPATAQGSGTGLGLSIAKLVVNRAGGRIWFEPGQSGASCILAIPAFTERLASQ
jgi:heavy metal sensor kinase